MANLLPADFEQYVQNAVAAGHYANTEAAYQEAFNLLRDRDRKLQQFRADIKEGVDALARGDYTTYDDAGLDALVDRIADEHEERMRQKRDRVG
jgi:putative addiction module CopG family antidote